MSVWLTGDTGLTAGGKAYRILAADLDGGVGPIAAAIRHGETDVLVRYPETGIHPNGLAYQDLQPPKVRP